MSKVIVCDNIEKHISYSKLDDPVIFELINGSDTIDLLNECIQHKIYYKIDALGGANRSSFKRTKIDVELSNVITGIQKSESIYTSIKTVHVPLFKLSDWEKLPNGYIGFCTQFSWFNEDYNKVFVWIYLDMEHLPKILSKFKNKLQYHKYESNK